MKKKEHFEKLDGLKSLYQNMAKIIGLDATINLFQSYRGLTVTFPTRLISADYVKEIIREKIANGIVLKSREIQHIAIMYGYLERQIRRYLKEILLENEQAENGNTIKENVVPYITKKLKEDEKNRLLHEDRKRKNGKE